MITSRSLPPAQAIRQRRRAAGAAWGVAPVVAAGFTAYSLHRTGVDVRDLAAFAVYAVVGLALPGVVLWRLLVSDRSWTLLAEIACGASLAYAVELATYLLCTHLGHPGLAFLWPLAPLAVSAQRRVRSRVWRRSDATTPGWWSGVLSALVVFAVAVLTRQSWATYPLDGAGARYPYVDTPYHLSLIGALSRDVPVDVPAVHGQPLYYHWFVHAELAAARHATGIEPLVLLTRLGPLLMALVVILGVAVLTQRLSHSHAVGAAAAVLLVCAGAAPLSLDFGALFLSDRIFLSPTTVFAMALLIAVIAVSAELLYASRLDHRGAWAVAVLVLGAVSGAKGSLLPVLLAGYLAVVTMGLVLDRRLHRAGLALFGVGVAWFLLAQHFIYGGSAQGTALQPFGIGDRLAGSLHVVHPSQPASFGLAAALTALYLVSRMTSWAGVAGMFTARQWRDPRAHFLVASGAAAAGGVAAFDNAQYNEVYFLLVAPPLLVVSSAWGLARLAEPLPTPVVRRTIVLSVAGALTIGFVAKEVFADRVVGSYDAGRLLWPAAGALLGAVAIAAAVAGTLRRPLLRRSVVTMSLATTVATVGLANALAQAGTMISSPGQQFRWPAPDTSATIGIGGIRAARWLRDHSDPKALVATNVHCRLPGTGCDHRTTWIAGFSERQMLLEGWSYAARSGEESERQHVPVPFVNFWRPELLQANDAVFSHPTEADVGTLHRRYGVDWLFVDRRFRADLAGLTKVARERARIGQYVVFSIG